MKEITLAATAREGVGKGPARQARFSGVIPAVLYGPEIKSQAIAINDRQFTAAMRAVAGTNAIFNLDLGGNASKVIVRDLQRDPVTSKVLHIDFHAISLTKPINISVPINFVGVPDGVQNDGGIMQTNMRVINILCLVDDIPDNIPVNVEELAVGESIHISDLTVPNATILDEGRRTVVVIAAPTVIKETVTEDEELEEGAEAAEGAEGAEGAAEGAEKPAEGADKSDDKK